MPNYLPMSLHSYRPESSEFGAVGQLHITVTYDRGPGDLGCLRIDQADETIMMSSSLLRMLREQCHPAVTVTMKVDGVPDQIIIRGSNRTAAYQFETYNRALDVYRSSLLWQNEATTNP